MADSGEANVLGVTRLFGIGVLGALSLALPAITSPAFASESLVPVCIITKRPRNPLLLLRLRYIHFPTRTLYVLLLDRLLST